MNTNGCEVEFRQKGDEFDMSVERDCPPFDDYVCGVLKPDEEGFYRFHPSNGVVMHCSLLRRVAVKISELNSGEKEPSK
jgi:hypothetical protein